MKSCPSCQQVYTDEGPDFCLNDGALLTRTASQYNPGAAYVNQWQQSARGWQPPPQGLGHPPTQYPPYGYGQPVPSGGGVGVSKAALFTGISSAVTLGIVFLVVATNRPNPDARVFVGLLAILSLIAGLAAIILGIVSLSMASRNPAIGKAKGVVGLCLGLIPVLLLLIGIIAASRRF
jgi:uncharacterized membrane protein